MKRTLFSVCMLVVLLFSVSLAVQGQDEAPDTLLFMRGLFNDPLAGNDLYLMDAEGHHERPLSGGTPGFYASAAWSHDGLNVAFSYSSDGIDFNVYTLAVDSGERTQLTESGLNWVSSWSADDTELLFWTDPPILGLYSVNLDGESETLFEDENHRMFPAFSPDGSQIVYSKNSLDAGYELYLYDTAAGTETALTDGYGSAFPGIAPWSPDGSQIVFTSTKDGDFEIYVLNLVDGEIRQLTTNETGDESPTWSPDGETIAFVNNADGDYEIYVMDTNSENVVQLTDNKVDDLYPSFRPPVTEAD